MSTAALRVLLVDDDEDDHILVRNVFLDIISTHYNIEWVSTYNEAFQMLLDAHYDVCLLDYRLGSRSGLEFLHETVAVGCQVPIIVLTGQGDYQIDVQVMEAGAADYLVKERLTADLLERSIRYAVRRNQTDIALRESEERFRQIFEKSLAIKLLIDPESGEIVYANPAASRFYGYGLEELKSMQIWDIDTLSREEILAEMAKAVEERRNQFQFRHRVSTGEIRDVEVHSSPIDFRGRRLLYSIVHDVTDRKRVEDALRESEARYRAVVEEQTELVSRFLPDGTLTFVNDAYSRYFGESPEELIGSRFWHHVPAEDCDKIREYLSALNPDTPVSVIEHPVVVPAGEVRWQQWTDRAVTDSEGRIVEIQAVGRDITERKQVEEALRRSERRYRTLVETMNEGLGVQDEHGTITFVNDRLCEIMGYSQEELIGRSVPELVDGINRSFYERGVIQRRLRKRASCEFELIAKDGKRIPAIVSLSPILDQDGTFRGATATVTDITSRKRAEEALRESERQLKLLSSQLLELQERERKRVADEIHDSVGQSLHTIKLHLEDVLQLTKVEKRLPDVRSIEELMHTVDFAIEEMKSIYTGLRPSILDDLGILAAMSWYLREFRKAHPEIRVEENISVREDEVPHHLKIILFRTLQGVLDNASKHSRATKACVSLEMKDRRLEFLVEDNGIGFNPSEGFFGENGKGGLGLATMQERIESSGGIFTIKSVKSMGTLVQTSWDTIPVPA